MDGRMVRRNGVLGVSRFEGGPTGMEVQGCEGL